MDPDDLSPSSSSATCGGKSNDNYNLALHVIALFVVLFQSIFSCSFPLIVKKVPQLKVPHHFLFLSRHFGTGVLIATAFVHLLPTAFVSLTDPCLPSFWNESYPAMAGLIAMTAVFFVVTIEMIFSTMNGGAMGGCHGGGGAYDPLVSPAPHFHDLASPRRAAGVSTVPTTPSSSHRRSGSLGFQLQRPEMHTSDHEEQPTYGAKLMEDYEGNSDDGESTELEELQTNRHKRNLSSSSRKRLPHSSLTEEQQQQKNLLQVMLLEAGILFHSVFIGMALSVATGSNFIVLFIAIVFHQTFEGFALGSRIASINTFSKRSWKPWLMCLAYGTTTPIGQAIGLATRNLYDPQSETGLLMVGTMNAISSGLLLFAGLVELLAEDFLSDQSYIILTGRERIQACVAVGAGAAGMALIGAWA